MANIKKTISVVCIHWGDLPNWFSLFLESCALTPQLDFRIFTDAEFPQKAADNIYFEKFSLSDFNVLATQKLGFKIDIKFPYKVCDFRPAFGEIFHDYLKEYDYWGFCDSDIIFRNLWEVIGNKINKGYDFISGYTDFISGPMCFIRNSDVLNSVYKLSGDYIKVFNSNEYEGFEEGYRNAVKPRITIIRLLLFILFTLRFGFNFKMGKFLTFRELKFRFFFFFKKFYSKVPGDFSEIIWHLKKRSKIKVSFGNFIHSDASFQRANNPNWVLHVTNIFMKEKKSNTMLPVFHFRLSKTRNDFKASKFGNNKTDFVLRPSGLETNE